MHTIQVRDVPEDAYETIRRRARRAGKSLQSYMRDRLIELAAAPDAAEAVDQLEQALARFPHEVTMSDLEADLDADRR